MIYSHTIDAQILIGAHTHATHCVPAPYLFPTRPRQKYCPESCALPAQREFKRRWWADNGPEWRNERTRGGTKMRGSLPIGEYRVPIIPNDCAKSQSNVTPKFAVQHYTVAEIASFWKLSEDTIRRLFEREPDVLVIESPKPRYGRRRYSTLRIPDFVVERVHRRQSRR
jgi:hypothetical protein